jgi:GWxTD domain-containing protein
MAIALALGTPEAHAQIPVVGDSAAARRDTVPGAGALRAALRRTPDDPALHLQLGVAYRRHWSPFVKVEGETHLKDALRLARAQRNRVVEAAAARELARAAWLRYETFGHRYRLIGAEQGAIDPLQAAADWNYVQWYFRSQAAPDPASGERAYTEAEDYLRAALAAAPDDVEASRLLGAVLADRERWEELGLLARAVTRASPQRPDGYLLAGLAAQRQGRIPAALRAFEAAFALMDSAGRRPYEDLGPILRRADERGYDTLTPTQQAEMRRLFWAVARPLELDSVNPVLTEFHARVVFADLRWTAPEEQLIGWQTDRGVTYIRYGPPDIWAVFRDALPPGSDLPTRNELELGIPPDRNLMPLSGGQVTTVWVYRASRLTFVFQNQPGFARARFAGEYGFFAGEARYAAPARFDNLPVVAAMDTVTTQLAQFLGPSGGTTLSVFGFVPVGRMVRGVDLRSADLELAAVVKDRRMRDVIRQVRSERVAVPDSERFETRSWRLDLVPDDYLLRIEARERATQRAARAVRNVAIERFARDRLRISDLVLADRVAPRDSSPQRWTDYLIDPSAGRVESGGRVAFLWETYNLSAGPGDIGRYRVQLDVAVEEIARRYFVTRIIGGVADAIGLTAEGENLVSLAFERDIAVGNRVAIPTHLDVELVNAPAGRYTATLTVTDVRTGATARRERRFVVGPISLEPSPRNNDD